MSICDMTGQEYGGEGRRFVDIDVNESFTLRITPLVRKPNGKFRQGFLSPEAAADIKLEVPRSAVENKKPGLMDKIRGKDKKLGKKVAPPEKEE